MLDSGGGILYSHKKSNLEGDFPGGPEVRNLPVSAGDVGSVTVWQLGSHMLLGVWATGTVCHHY